MNSGSLLGNPSFENGEGFHHLQPDLDQGQGYGAPSLEVRPLPVQLNRVSDHQYEIDDIGYHRGNEDYPTAARLEYQRGCNNRADRRAKLRGAPDMPVVVP
jgi:hypothetical protein